MNTKTTKKADAVRQMIATFRQNFYRAKKQQCDVVYLTKDQFEALGVQPGQVYDGVRLERYH